MDRPHKLAHSGLGISAFGIALLAGAGLLVAFEALGSDPVALWLNGNFLSKVMVACGLLETVSVTLAGTALADTRYRTTFPIAALLLACGPLALVIASLFGVAD